MANNRMGRVVAASALATLLLASSARAGAVWVGAYGHDAIAPDRHERGLDFQFGYRTDRIDSLSGIGRPEADAFVMFNTRTSTHMAAVGLSWPINLGEGVYLRPGFGLAYTTGKAVLPPANAPGLSPAEIQRRINLAHRRIDFGSNVLFKPELALGVNVSERLALEVSYVHFSHGQVFHQGKNQGLDDLGARVVWRFGAD
jgi:hypothetical protein